MILTLALFCSWLVIVRILLIGRILLIPRIDLDIKFEGLNDSCHLALFLILVSNIINAEKY